MTFEKRHSALKMLVKWSPFKSVNSKYFLEFQGIRREIICNLAHDDLLYSLGLGQGTKYCEE